MKQFTLVNGVDLQATGQSSGVDLYANDVDPGSVVGIITRVSAISGAGATITMNVEWSYDNTNFFAADTTADAFAAITTVSGKAKQFAIKARYMRVNYTIAGTTPHITTSVVAITK